MRYCNFRISKFILSLLLLIQIQSVAQYNSPFSRYGLGNKIDNMPINYRGMGGAGIADNNASIINALNPATFAGIRFATLQFALNGSINDIQTNTSSNNAGKTDLGYLQIGFPITKNTGTSFGLMSEYQTRYTLRSIGTIAGSDSTFNNYYNGKGTLAKVYWGLGHNYKNFSLGVSAYYLFGNTVHVIDKIFNSFNINNFYFQDSTHYGGLGWQAGALYEKKINNNYILHLGASYNAAVRLKSSQHTYNAGYSYASNGFGVYDTIYNPIAVTGKTIIPARLGFGVSLLNATNWRINADFNTQNASSFIDNGNKDSVTNNWMANVGFAFTPESKSFQNYWKASEYRFGLFYGKDYIKVFDDISIAGLSLGIGIPLRKTAKSFGQVNTSIQIGKRGNLTNNKVSETFFRLGLGLTFNDKWFVKRKYD